MFKESDIVYVPWPYDTSWEPQLTKIEYIDNGIYYCKVKQRNFSSFNATDNEHIYGFADNIFADRESCEEYIRLYYYDGLCDGCKYADVAGTVLKCNVCKHRKIIYPDNPVDNPKEICGPTGVFVAVSDICSNFSPALPQYESWSWARYEDLLKNCEFNKECIHHLQSVHKTCDYDKYLNEWVKIPVDDEKIEYLYITRNEWNEQSFFNGSPRGYWYHGVRFKPEYTKTGKIKKGTLNRSEFYDEVKLWELSNKSFY